MTEEQNLEAFAAEIGVTTGFGHVVVLLGDERGAILLSADTADALAEGLRLCAEKVRAQEAAPAGAPS